MTAWWQTLWHHDQASTLWIVIVALTAIAAWTDCRSRVIPNLLTAPMLLAGLIAAALLGGWTGLADALVGMCLCSILFVFMFLFAGGGAGDAKLMAAVGAWTGVVGGSLALIAVLLSGAVLSISWILWHRKARAVWINFFWILISLRTAVAGRGVERRAYILPQAEALHPMPYGLAIFLGCSVAAGVVLL